MAITFLKSSRFQASNKKKIWSNQDIADFYRAVEILQQAGLSIEIDSGQTDEGDSWFVFFRPENGDVIAHFALIEGSFIAVSSLTNEIYRGDNIRTIVDQMLQSYPTLLPQKKSGTKLLLHPTAAISAFLAAAFILNIDGVKARDIAEVLVAAAAPANKAAENLIAPAEPVLNDSLLRGDTLKIMFSELNSAAYNVAVLGVVLIVHELGSGDIASEKELEDHLSITSMRFENNEAKEPDDKTYSNYEYGESNKTTSDSPNQIKISGLNNFEQDNRELDKNNEEQEDVDSQGYGGNFTLVERQNEEGTDITEVFNGEWIASDVLLIEKKSPGAVIPSENLLLQSSWFGSMVDTGSTEKGHLVDEGIGHTTGPDSFPEVDVSIKRIGEVLSTKAEPLVFSTLATIEPFNVIGDNDTSLGSLVTVLEDAELALNPVFEGLSGDTLALGSEPETLETVSLPDVGIKQPMEILGHPVIENGDSLRLTGAIDVVFYKLTK